MTTARLWVHLPRAEAAEVDDDEEEEQEEQEEEHVWLNLYSVAVDKYGDFFRTQEAASKVSRKIVQNDLPYV